MRGSGNESIVLKNVKWTDQEEVDMVSELIQIKDLRLEVNIEWF